MLNGLWGRRALIGAALWLCCAAGASRRTRRRKKPFRVVTTFTVIQDIAQNVAGSAAVVESITKPGAEIHDYQPTPLDIVRAQAADLVLWNGFNLERWFEKFFENVKEVPAVTVTEGVEPMGIAEGPYTGKPNPHAWMSPNNALIYVENIRKALVKHDPANADAYNKNAADYAAKIKALDEPLRKRLAAIPENQRWLVSSEGAFSYLTRDYKMQEAYLWPINADEQGTPKQVRKVIDLVRKNKIPVVFSESTISDRAAKQVARETGASYGGVLYVDSLSAVGGPGADLSRPAQGDGRDDREGVRQVNARRRAVRAADPAALGASISVRDLTVTYNNGFTAVQNASFDLDPGTICALVGVNGSGKSTIFKAIMGFVRPSAGEVRLCGRPVAEALKRNIVAYVPQSEDVDWNFPVLVEDVVMMGRYGHMNFLRMPSRADRYKVDEALERVGMTDYRDAADRRTLRRPEEARVPRALARAGGADHPARRAVHRRRREDRGRDHRPAARTARRRAPDAGLDPQSRQRAGLSATEVVLINQTVLAAGPTAEVFTQANLERAFGGVLRHFNLGGTALHDDADTRRLTVLTDDERPLVFYGDEGKRRDAPNGEAAK